MYITSQEGDQIRVEIGEDKGSIYMEFAGKTKIRMTPEDAFDLIDVLTMAVADNYGGN